MRNLIQNALRSIAQQVVDQDEQRKHSLESLRKLVTIGVATAVLSVASYTPDAQASDQNYGRILGGGVGALVGASLGKHMPVAQRTAVAVVAGTAGAWVGESIGHRMDDNARAAQAAERARQFEQQRQQNRSYSNVPAVRQTQFGSYQRPDQGTAIESRGRGGYAQSEQVFDPTAFGMPEVIANSLRASGNIGLVADGGSSLSATAAKQLHDATDSLSRTGKIYSAANSAWEASQLESGQDRLAVQARMGTALKNAEKLVQQKASVWANVRNVLASQGFDVSASDEKVKNEFAGLSSPRQYDFRINTGMSPR